MNKAFRMTGLAAICAGGFTAAVAAEPVSPANSVNREKTRKIRFIEDDAQEYMLSKVYTLKHIKANDIVPFVLGAVKRYSNNSKVDRINYSAGRGEAVKTVEAAHIKDDSSIKFYLNAPADGGRGPEITTKPVNGFAFNMTVTPSVTEKATTLKVGVTATSLLGYASSGAPRLATSVSENDVMIGNSTGNRFVIGGIRKSEIVRSSTGIPLLKDIPVLGWLFSSEGESTKNSQLVIVAECELVTPATAIPAGLQGDITDIKKAVSGNTSGEFNSYGFRQFGLDPER